MSPFVGGRPESAHGQVDLRSGLPVVQERLTAKAIREGKNLEALVAEILESASE